MKVKNGVGILIGVVSMLILVICFGCVKQRPAALQAAEPAQPKEAAPLAPEQVESVYNVQVTPLTRRRG